MTSSNDNKSEQKAAAAKNWMSDFNSETGLCVDRKWGGGGGGETCCQDVSLGTKRERNGA